MKRRRGWDIKLISISAHLPRGKNDITKEKICSRFLFWKALCRACVCSEYCFLRRLIRRNADLQVPEFHRVRIIDYQQQGLTFFDTAFRNGRHPSTVIWNQWATESKTERDARSQRTLMTNTRKDSHIVMSALQNRINKSRTNNQKLCMFAARCQIVEHYLDFPWNAAQSTTVTLVRQKTSMIQKWHDVVFPDHIVPFFDCSVVSAIFWWSYAYLVVLRRNQLLGARHAHLYFKSTVIWKQIRMFLASYIQ